MGKKKKGLRPDQKPISAKTAEEEKKKGEERSKALTFVLAKWMQ